MPEEPLLQKLEQMLFLYFPPLFLLILQLTQHLHQRRSRVVAEAFCNGRGTDTTAITRKILYNERHVRVDRVDTVRGASVSGHTLISVTRAAPPLAEKRSSGPALAARRAATV